MPGWCWELFAYSPLSWGCNWELFAYSPLILDCLWELFAYSPLIWAATGSCLLTQLGLLGEGGGGGGVLFWTCLYGHTEQEVKTGGSAAAAAADLAPGLPTYSKYYEGVMSRGLIGRRGPGSVCVLQQGPMKNYTVHGRVDGGNLAPLRIPIQPNIYVKSNVYRALPDFLYPLTWFRVDMGASAGADEEPHTGWMGETLHLHHYSHYTETAIGCEV